MTTVKHDARQRVIPKALTCAPVAFHPVGEEVILMHHRGLDDAHGRPRAQEGAAQAHEGKQAVGTARLGEGGDEAVRSTLKRGSGFVRAIGRACLRYRARPEAVHIRYIVTCIAHV